MAGASAGHAMAHKWQLTQRSASRSQSPSRRSPPAPRWGYTSAQGASGAVHAAGAGRLPYRAPVGQRALEARHGKRRLLVQHGRPPERAPPYPPTTTQARGRSGLCEQRRAPGRPGTDCCRKNCLISHDAPLKPSRYRPKPLTSRAAHGAFRRRGQNAPHGRRSISLPRAMPFKHT